LGVFLYRVVTYSLNDGQINTTIAKYRVGKLKIKNYYPQFVFADPEDITVINHTVGYCTNDILRVTTNQKRKGSHKGC